VYCAFRNPGGWLGDWACRWLSGRMIDCGIMGDMENPNLEDTQPTKIKHQTVKETGPEQPEKVEAVLQAGGFDDTAPTSVEQISAPVEEIPALVGQAFTPVEEMPASSEQTSKTAVPGQISGSPASSTLPLNRPKALQPIPATRKIKKDQPTGKRRPAWIWITLLGLMALGIIALLSAFSGYQSGISLRKAAQSTQVAQSAQEQYELGIQDMSQGAYDRARQRFEYIIKLDPGYPGAVEKLSEVLMYLNTTATPTLEPTSTVQATPDLRGVQELFDQAQQYLATKDWGNAIDTLLTLRKTDANFKPIDVDGMLFLALRSRGASKILNADLEGGIYDLTLAQRFGPLDAEAAGLLSWASLYITGASFWEIDWGQAAYYFGQVAPYAPNLHDGSGLTASERYWTSLVNYANQLIDQKKFCQAQAQLEIALSIRDDSKVRQVWEAAAQHCSGGQNPQGPGEKPTDTPTP
jgi:tetratricopeptide (TPR) repeat protein